MKRQIALERLMQAVIIATVLIIGVQYYFYREKENKIKEENARYFAEVKGQ